MASLRLLLASLATVFVASCATGPEAEYDSDRGDELQPAKTPPTVAGQYGVTVNTEIDATVDGDRQTFVATFKAVMTVEQAENAAGFSASMSPCSIVGGTQEQSGDLSEKVSMSHLANFVRFDGQFLEVVADDGSEPLEGEPEESTSEEGLGEEGLGEEGSDSDGAETERAPSLVLEVAPSAMLIGLAMNDPVNDSFPHDQDAASVTDPDGDGDGGLAVLVNEGPDVLAQLSARVKLRFELDYSDGLFSGSVHAVDRVEAKSFENTKSFFVNVDKKLRNFLNDTDVISDQHLFTADANISSEDLASCNF